MPPSRPYSSPSFAWIAAGASIGATKSGASAGRDAAGALSHIYATEPFLDLAAGPDEVSLKAVVGTNRCQIGLAADAGRIVVISAIDNLVKGAAGQAVQNLNLALGWPETSGLDTLRGFNP